jgi:threonine dehydrogenase-like Zn-dependent dehydrogenase
VFDPTPAERPAGEHAVRVRVELAGVCRSDLKEMARERHGPSQFGHELVGVVAESTLPGALPVGARVVLDPNVRLARTTGFATALYAAGPADLLTAALPRVPDTLPARRAVFAEPLACARHCVAALARHTAAPVSGRRIAVLGAGTAGLLIARLAGLAGASVTLVNRSRDRADFARSLGLDVHPPHTLAPATFDASVVATDFVHPEVLTEALRLVLPDGVTVLFGGTAPGDELKGLACDLDTIRRSQARLRTTWSDKPVRIAGSYGITPEDFTAAIDALPLLPLEHLITREIALGELPSVLREQLTGRPLGKTLIRPTP